jgi:hypothetical protein
MLYYPLTTNPSLRHHHLNRADRLPYLDVLNLVPAVGITSSALSLAPFAPRAIVESNSKGAALGRLAVLAPIREGHERVSVADAHIGRGGVVEGTVAVSAEAVVV